MYYKKRYYGSDVHIYEFSPHQERIDADIGIKGKLEVLSKIGKAQEGEEIAAKINASFFDHAGVEYYGVYADEGKVYQQASPTFLNVVFTHDSKLQVLDKVTPEILSKCKWAIGGSFQLLPMIRNTEKFPHYKQRHPRTAIGQKPDGTVILIVVQGRKLLQKGTTAWETAEIMQDLGCTVAVNLDGGGSSEMIVDGKIVNQPTDGAERAIGAALIIYRKKGGVRMFNVLNDLQLSKNFKLSEFACKDGTKTVMLDMVLVEKLQQLRGIIGKPIQIVSGYRTKEYNKKIGGAPRSQHMKGKAADIKIKGVKPLEVAKIAEIVGFKGNRSLHA